MPYADQNYAIRREIQHYWKNKSRIKDCTTFWALKAETAKERGEHSVLKLLQDAAANKSKSWEGSETGGGDGEGTGGGVGVPKA